MLLQLVEPGLTLDPHETQDEIAIGIDLGTTHSLVAVTVDGQPHILRDEEGEGRLPSVVRLLTSGELSAENSDDEAAPSIRSFKRVMGRSAEDALRQGVPYAITAGEGMVTFSLKDRQISPVALSAEVLKALKRRAENALGQAVQKAVITVPAYFEEAQRSATRDAARLAGLEVLRLLSEPTAAALAYGLERGVQGNYLVYDLGGGTFDVSLLTLHQDVFQVKATGGDTNLGGDDFDRAISEHWMACEGRSFSDLHLDEQRMLLLEARTAKERLSSAPLFSGKRSLKAADLKNLIHPMTEKTLTLAKGVLKDADVKPEDLKGVLLVGGSTRMPLVIEAVSNAFSCPLYHDLNPDEVVALGAALQAHALSYGASRLLLDVTPLSLGLETMGGLVEKIIYRNTPIPCHKTQTFTTYEDGQTAMTLHVVQGEREFAKDCRSLARFELRDLPPLPAGIARIDVTFSLDADGLLTVSARETTTGKETHIEVKPSYGLDHQQMTEMLLQSQAHGREDMEARLLEQKRVEAARLLLDLNSALQKDGDLVGKEELEALEKARENLKEAKGKGDRQALEGALEILHRLSLPFAERRMNRALREALQGKSLGEVA